MSAVLLLKTSVFCAISAVFQQFYYTFSAPDFPFIFIFLILLFK